MLMSLFFAKTKVAKHITSLNKKMKFTIKDFFGKCERISGQLQIRSYLLKK